jgi:hypothetical protein
MKLIALLFAVLLSVTVTGQKKHLRPFDSSIQLTVSPNSDLGIGLKYTYKYLYISAARSSYSLPDNGSIDHYRASLGYFKTIMIDRMTKLTNLYCAGVVYNMYSNSKYRTLALNHNQLFPVSAEIGVGMGMGRLSAMIRYDVLKFDCYVDFGFNF